MKIEEIILRTLERMEGMSYFKIPLSQESLDRVKEAMRETRGLLGGYYYYKEIKEIIER